MSSDYIDELLGEWLYYTRSVCQRTQSEANAQSTHAQRLYNQNA